MLGMIIFQWHKFITRPFVGENQRHIFSLSFHLDQMCPKISEKMSQNAGLVKDNKAKKHEAASIYVLYERTSSQKFNFWIFKSSVKILHILCNDFNQRMTKIMNIRQFANKSNKWTLSSLEQHYATSTSGQKAVLWKHKQ